MALVGFQVEGCPLLLHRFFQGVYVVLNYIYFDGSEQKICSNCVDKLQGSVKVRDIEEGGRNHYVRVRLII